MGRCKRPRPKEVAQETTAEPKCSSQPVESKPPVQEEPEYELLLQVVEDITNKPLAGVDVSTMVEGSKLTITTDEKGIVCVDAIDAGTTYDLTVEMPDSGLFTLKTKSPKATTQLKGGAPAKIILERALFEIVSVDPGFVPTGKADAENLQIKYNISKIGDRDVYLVIMAAKGTYGAALYSYKLTSAEKADGSNKILKWDGKITEGDQKGELAKMKYGPFEVYLRTDKPNQIFSERLETGILIHSINIKHGSYLEDPDAEPARITPAPVSGASAWNDHLKWIQYRLNKLGYFAGAVDGVLTDQTKRAVKRYTYEMINYPEADFSGDTSDLGKARFLDSLAGESLKVELFERGGAISDKAYETKIYIQNNYYYHTEGARKGIKDLSTIDGQWVKENDHSSATGGKLDRFERPLLAEIMLLSRSGEAVAPGALLDGVKVKWTVSVPEKDLSGIPAYAPDKPSNALNYIKRVYATLKDKTAYPNNIGDNCPEECGGVKHTDAYFESNISCCAVTAGADQTHVYSQICADDKKTKLVGKSTVLFKASNIAGDSFKVSADISFHNLSKETELTRAHAARPADQLHAETGKMTVWRQRRITSVIDWMEAKAAAVQWAGITAAYKAAYINLDTSGVSHDLISDIVEDRDKAAYLDNVADTLFANLPNTHPGKSTARNSYEFRTENLYPMPPLVMQAGEEANDYHAFRTRLFGPRDFTSRISELSLGSDTYPFGEWIAGIVGRTKRPGFKILRVLPFKGGTAYEKKLFKSVPIILGRDEGTASTGIGGGVAFICEGHRNTLKDEFLLTHEMAHCIYIRHPFQYAEEHDMDDKNDVMYYLDGGAGNRPANTDPVSMARGSTQVPLFCGKCLLKLRGWKVNTKDAEIEKILPGKAAAATPVNPRMTFDGFFIVEGTFLCDNNEMVQLRINATDPANTSIVLGPLSFLHPHTFTWESSDGNLASLAHLETREYITWDAPTQDSPFNLAADPDQEFAQNGGKGDQGVGTDDHSMRLPGLICARPLKAGKLTAKQTYQYRVTGVKGGWKDIPEAEYTLEKEVFHNGTEWVLKFIKKNGSSNPNAFHFEVHYKIGDAPVSQPKILPNPDYNTSGQPVGFKGAKSGVYVHNGDRMIRTTSESRKATTLEELEKLGYLASGDWKNSFTS